MAFVVFAGQSNTGGAFMNASTLSRPWTADPLTLIWDAGAKAWVQMQPGVNTGYGGHPSAWGPEVQFALDFRTAFPGEALRILKHAEGGTSLAPDWTDWHYDWSPQSPSELFDRTTAMIAEAGATLGGARPSAVFFGQGEADASHSDSAAAYASNLPAFLAALRQHWMGDAGGKIGLFQIGRTTGFADQVRAAQQTTDQQDPNTDSFDAQGFPLQADAIHYTPAGFDLIGAGFARMYAAWRGGEPFTPSAGPLTLIGGAGNDTLSGGAGADFLRGGEGDDRMSGGEAFDDMHGNQGSDTLSGDGGDDWVVGGKDGDLLFGGDGGDIVYGNLGDDTVEGGAGADVVRGGQGDDLVHGGAGDDFVSGDRGTDTLSGGTGADRFHTFADAGWDYVTDFRAAEGDQVQLLPGSTYTLSQVGDDLVVNVGEGRLVLLGVQAASLPPGWIFSG